MKKILLVLFLLLLIPTISYSKFDITVQSNEVTFLRGMNFYEHLKRRLSKADSRIWISSYVVSKPTSKAMKTIHKILEEKISDGVEVKFLAEKDLEDNKKALKKLKNIGVQTRLHEDTKLLHAKFSVIGDKYVYNGSANFSTTAFWRGGETTVFIESKKLNVRFEKYFSQIWQESVR